ncbi:MAG: FecR domain-containing protein [Steroidobacteraceae bacterium]
MSSLVEFPDVAVLREQAATWIVRRERGLSASEQAEFQRWCASPANVRILRQLGALYEEMDALQTLSIDLPEAAASSTPALHRWRPAIAAGLAAALVLAGVGIHRKFESTSSAVAAPAPLAFTTAMGEHRSLPLADGSLLAMNTDSRVEVQPLTGGPSRELKLVRGEAHFTVAHDAARPFRVRAGGQIIQAVGTAFDVRLHGGGEIEVVVTEGRVKLIPRHPAAEHLERGQSLLIARDGSARVSTLDNDALGSRLAWRNGMVVFDGQTLADALEEFARYTPTRFEIDDPQLRQLRVGGYFPAGDTAFLVDALHNSFGLVTTRDANGTIRINRRR